MGARCWLDASYRCEGGSGPNTSRALFVCTLTKGKKSPGEELQGEGIDWVLFPERLEWLQEAPSVPPGKLDITRLVLGVAVSPPPLPGCLIRFPEPSTPLPCSAATEMPVPGNAMLSQHHRGHGTGPAGQGHVPGMHRGVLEHGHALSKVVPQVCRPPSLVAGDVE